MGPRVILHVDLDYFFAQCEENANPDIRGKPVVVCVYSGRTSDSGVVSTCNYEARKYGLRSGIPITRAKTLLKGTEAIFLPVNHALYSQVSSRIMELLRGRADIFEQVGIDEAYLDVSETVEYSFQRGRELAFEIKRSILNNEHVTCSIGVAPNKLLAKIASDHEKPDGLTLIEPDRVTGFLEKLPVDRIPGVGVKIREKLGGLQVNSTQDLLRVKLEMLIKEFGKSVGNHLYMAARGQDDEPVKEAGEPTQVSRIATLSENTRQASKIIPSQDELLHSAAEKLKEKRMVSKRISLIIILEDLSIHTKSKSIESPLSDLNKLRELSHTLLSEFLDANPSAVIRRIGVRFSDLSREGDARQVDIGRFLAG